MQGSSDDWKARINEAGEIAVNTTKADGTAPGLSDDTFTTAEKTKLADLPSNSELQEQIGDEVAAVTERLDDHDEAVEALRTDKADKADVYTKAEIDGKIASALHYKGSVPTEGDLPAAGNAIGDVYNILDTGKNAAWDGTAWDNLSGVVSLTDYMTRQETSTAINAEAAAREAGDIALQTNLGLTNSAVSNEITNRQTADQTLQANINAANAALTLEAQARTSSDEALALNIVNLGNALTQEASGRDDADTALREELTDYIDQSLAAAVQATSYAGTLDTESGLPDSGTVHGQYYEIDDMDITAPGSSGRAVWNAVTQPAQWDIRTDRQREADGETIGFRTSDGALKILDVSLAAPAEDNTPPAAKTDTLKNILQWLTNKIAGLFDLVSAKADLTAKSTLAVGSTVYDPFAGASGNKTIALVNDLTTGGSNAVLSAEQGKVLKTALDGLVKLVLPVGTVMGFYTALDPNTQYPGTAWVKLGNDVFLRSVTGTPGGTGGANTDTDVVAHTHTTPATGIASSGAHTHNIKSRQWNNYANGYISSTDGTKAETSVSNGNTDGAHTHTVPAMTTNGQSASVASHNNRPAYIDIVFWKRTA